MCTVAVEPLLHSTFRRVSPRVNLIDSRKILPFSVKFNSTRVKFGEKFCRINPSKTYSFTACSATTISNLSKISQTDDDVDDVVYNETFELGRIKKVEGKIYIRLDKGEDVDNWELTVGCTLPGKWALHWGVHYVGDVGSEWDQPPEEIRPPGSITIKDYAIETPFRQSPATEGGDAPQEVNINFNCSSKIGAVNFVLKDEETGSWYQHKGRDLVVPLVGSNLRDGDNVIGAKRDIGSWPGSVGQLSNLNINEEGSQQSDEAPSESPAAEKPLEAFNVELPISKEIPVSNSLSVSVKKCRESSKLLVNIETDLPGNVVVHWGVCRNNSKVWELPATPHPPNTEVFKNKALRTQLQKKQDGIGAKGLFTLDEEVSGFPFVLKLNDDSWLNNKGSDFFVPLSGSHVVGNQSEDLKKLDEKLSNTNEEVPDAESTDGIIKNIRNLVTGISSEKKWKTKTKEAQETILQEIEMLAAEAYSIFRSSKTFSEEAILEIEAPPEIRSGTGSGFEIVCQGFNWESHKSGRWYMELMEKAEELSSLGFTVVWLPPPTESVSPEGYMPKDLYNLNSRYGTIDELKAVVKRFHEVGIKTLGDAVLNHRCAHSKNQNGVWNIFGGRLNWDDRAVVADDPHFQGRGNKSSGDNFHAAPNIDHSQDFVRNDIKEWLCWLRKDIGYDGWRLDFVRGFWGGYVKDYIDASTPYFAVGEYWDSLSYTYGEMDYDQDAHRQRIVDWINATGGTAGAFDVTTKGILHAALERCEYWRLTDSKGKPPGVVGWWPSRAITFIENHDTGSTQGHWRFPGGKEMQGYAYILTHPGTPAVFYDHIFSHYKSEISSLLAVRIRNKINCRSTIKINKADRDVYAATIDDKVTMKIGPGHYEPPNDSQNWSIAVEGNDYKVWEAV
ncbi:hypothetical protein RND81_11G031600 [Saponaria officinalis]|uniref:alpha-amylase n=1 Tax=Saponaria officinalis TaxID=3572 RepID=A0AAW1HIZ8_SAPOF